TLTEPGRFDEHPHLLGVKNGVLDLKNKELLEGDPNRIIITQIPVKYEPEADCPNIRKYLNSLFKDEKNVDKIVEFIGYTLLRENPLNKAFMGLGPGANGRSTLFELIHNFLGKENTEGIGLRKLVTSDYASAKLYGKLANLCADISNKIIRHSENFKKQTGEDWMHAREIYKPPFKFKSYATPYFSANELPQTKDTTRSFFRRWVIVNFPYTFTDDPDELKKEGYKEKNLDLPDSIMTEKEFSGLLNWALEGLHRVLEKKKFRNERTIDEKRRLWLRESDPVREFIDDWCIEDPESVVEKELIREVYRNFCLENGYNQLAAQTLTKRLKKYGIETSRPRTEKGRVQCYIGIKVKPEKIKDEEHKDGQGGQGSRTLPYRNTNNSGVHKGTSTTTDYPDQNNDSSLFSFKGKDEFT
ncbi:MAG: phage/plasmid primase, P4 family, partial [Thermoplasmata archaeon]